MTDTKTAVDAPETFAAVDLGSNSFHMIVARPGPDEMIVEDRLREMIQFIPIEKKNTPPREAKSMEAWR